MQEIETRTQYLITRKNLARKGSRKHLIPPWKDRGCHLSVEEPYRQKITLLPTVVFVPYPVWWQKGYQQYLKLQIGEILSRETWLLAFVLLALFPLQEYYGQTSDHYYI